MTERTEKIQTSDGAMEVFIAHPEGEGPFPIVIQLMDALGMREELREHARRTARWGYYVLAPDLFYRAGLKGPLDFSDPNGRQQIMAAMSALTDALVTRDAEATLALAAGDAAAATGRIGLYGFCMGGRLALVLCQALGERVAAAASLHPGGLATGEANSPHLHLDRVKAELYFGIADQDPSATPEQMAELEKALKAHNVAYQLEWHPGARHGYTMQSRKDVYQEAAAEKVRDRMEALFARKLA
jgi:carboxymethylenebutenolidase